MNAVRILLLVLVFLLAISTTSCQAAKSEKKVYTTSDRSNQKELQNAHQVELRKNTTVEAETKVVQVAEPQAKNRKQNKNLENSKINTKQAKGNKEKEKVQQVKPNVGKKKPVKNQDKHAKTSEAEEVRLFQFKKLTTKGLDIKLGKSCVTADCHANMSKAKFIHGPVAISACNACHKTVGEPTDEGKLKPKHQFTFEKLGNDLCYSCHNRQDTGEVVHEPVKRELCTVCHDPHKSENRFLLVRPTIGETCYKCHEDSINKDDKYAHGPVAVGACITCHNSHSSNNRKLLIASGNELCFLCHDKIKVELSTLKYKHKAAVENCCQCHNHHTSPNKYQLKKTIPQLCADCHAETVMYTEVAVTQHGAITSGDKCLNCHGPHATNYPYELREPPINLCLKCHNKEIKTPTGTIINMKAELANNSNHHGPIRQGNCVPCHNVHGSEFYRLLNKYFPPEFYAPFKVKEYSLCFECHEQTLVLDEHTTSLTDFRNGDLNLHYLHVNKETKGRTCRACHKIHASNNPKHIREWTLFGPIKWKLPIGFKKTNTGGSCAPGCHKPKSYDRLKPFDYAR